MRDNITVSITSIVNFRDNYEARLREAIPTGDRIVTINGHEFNIEDSAVLIPLVTRWMELESLGKAWL